MRPDRMTTKSREAFVAAVEQASRRGNPEVYPDHLFWALLDQVGGAAGAEDVAGAEALLLLRRRRSKWRRLRIRTRRRVAAVAVGDVAAGFRRDFTRPCCTIRSSGIRGVTLSRPIRAISPRPRNLWTRC